MFGTFVNCVVIILCSGVGLLLKGGIKERYKEILMQALGLSTLYVGASGAVGGLLNENAHPLLFVLSLVIGAFVGEWIGIEDKLTGFGDWMEAKTKNSDSNISQGFVSASLIFCVGTMAILGSIESGINQNYSILYVKTILDGTLSLILASSMGIGVMLSAIPVFLYQGGITLFASVLQPLMTEDILREMNIVGGILISVIGLNLMKITTIKIGNFLPGVLVPGIYYFIVSLLG